LAAVTGKREPVVGCWLFDLDADPRETTDLSDALPAVVAHLRRRIDETADKRPPQAK